jgi:hypothetical protein
MSENGGESSTCSLWTTSRVFLDNLSHGMHSITLDWIKMHWSSEFKSCVLVTEPKETESTISNYLNGISVEALPKVPDLNVLICWDKKYDVTVCQAVLEHVCRPSIALENLIRLTNVNGLVSVHTHTVRMGYHPYPVDCVRFWPDFFIEIQKYIPAKLLEVYSHNTDIFSLYKVLM